MVPCEIGDIFYGTVFVYNVQMAGRVVVVFTIRLVSPIKGEFALIGSIRIK